MNVITSNVLHRVFPAVIHHRRQTGEKLSQRHIAVLNYMLNLPYANGCFKLPYRDISAHFGMSLNTAVLAVNRLCEYDYIKKYKHGFDPIKMKNKPNTYQINFEKTIPFAKEHLPEVYDLKAGFYTTFSTLVNVMDSTSKLMLICNESFDPKKLIKEQFELTNQLENIEARIRRNDQQLKKVVGVDYASIWQNWYTKNWYTYTTRNLNVIRELNNNYNIPKLASPSLSMEEASGYNGDKLPKTVLPFDGTKYRSVVLNSDLGGIEFPREIGSLVSASSVDETGELASLESSFRKEDLKRGGSYNDNGKVNDLEKSMDDREKFDRPSKKGEKKEFKDLKNKKTMDLVKRDIRSGMDFELSKSTNTSELRGSLESKTTAPLRDNVFTLPTPLTEGENGRASNARAVLGIAQQAASTARGLREVRPDTESRRDTSGRVSGPKKTKALSRRVAVPRASVFSLMDHFDSVMFDHFNVRPIKDTRNRKGDEDDLKKAMGSQIGMARAIVLNFGTNLDKAKNYVTFVISNWTLFCSQWAFKNQLPSLGTLAWGIFLERAVMFLEYGTFDSDEVFNRSLAWVEQEMIEIKRQMLIRAADKKPVDDLEKLRDEIKERHQVVKMSTMFQNFYHTLKLDQPYELPSDTQCMSVIDGMVIRTSMIGNGNPVAADFGKLKEVVSTEISPSKEERDAARKLIVEFHNKPWSPSKRVQNDVPTMPNDRKVSGDAEVKQSAIYEALKPKPVERVMTAEELRRSLFTPEQRQAEIEERKARKVEAERVAEEERIRIWRAKLKASREQQEINYKKEQERAAREELEKKEKKEQKERERLERYGPRSDS